MQDDAVPLDTSLWSEFNEAQRVDSLKFAKNTLMPSSVALWHLCMAPCARLTCLMLDAGSEEWDTRQEHSAATAGVRSCRIQEARR